MKKIILISGLSLASLMADFTLSDNQLTPVGEPVATLVPEPTPTPTQTPAPALEPITDPSIGTQPNGSKVIPNSVDMIWNDMVTGSNTGWVSNMPSGYKQFKGSDYQDIIAKRSVGSITHQNIWFEIEAGGDGSDCSQDMNRASNTVVEVGWTRGYLLGKDNVWRLATQTRNQINTSSMHLANGDGDGTRHPHGQQNWFPMGTSRCNISTKYFYNIQTSNANEPIFWKDPNGFTTVQPKNYYRYHAWAAQFPINLSNIKAIFGQMYVRLKIKDPSKPDDRHLANYVAHIASDSYDKTASKAYQGGNGHSIYKRITNDWQPVNFLNGNLTKAQLESNPPPFSSMPLK